MTPEEEKHVKELHNIIDDNGKVLKELDFKLAKAEARIKAQDEKISELRLAKQMACDTLKSIVGHIADVY